MLKSVIDIGSNSVRMLIGTADGGVVNPQEYFRIATRLASGLSENNMLKPTNMDKTIDAAASFAEEAKGMSVESIIAVGTSALREALNSRLLLKSVKQKTGLDIKVLSQYQEARLTALGAVQAGAAGSAIVVDIGGGSTEVALVMNAVIEQASSYPFGVVKVAERCMKDDPPSETDLICIQSESTNTANCAHDNLNIRSVSGLTLLFTAGTASTLASIDLSMERFDWRNVHGHRLSLMTIKDIFNRLVSTPLRERAKIKGIEQARADLIIPGTALTIKLMEGLGFDVMTVSSFGLLEGVLLADRLEAIP